MARFLTPWIVGKAVTTGYFGDARRSAFRVVALQSFASLLAAAIAAPVAGLVASEAVLIGGLIAASANLVMTWRVFGGRVERDPKRILSRMLLGEMLKFAFTVLAFAVAIVILKAAFLPLIVGYLAAFAAYWVGYILESLGKT